MSFKFTIYAYAGATDEVCNCKHFFWGYEHVFNMSCLSPEMAEGWSAEDERNNVYS